MLIKADFGMMDDLAAQIQAAVARVESEIESWARAAGVTLEGWVDGAGGEFEGVSAAWSQISVAQNEMLQALQGGVVASNENFRQAHDAARAVVASTKI